MYLSEHELDQAEFDELNENGDNDHDHYPYAAWSLIWIYFFQKTILYVFML